MQTRAETACAHLILYREPYAVGISAAANRDTPLRFASFIAPLRTAMAF